MERFSENTTCPKCGNDKNLSLYYFHTLNTQQEYLQITCSRCKYCWKMNCLDAKDDELDAKDE